MRTAVLLCGDGLRAPDGSRRARHGAQVVSGLCEQPRQIGRLSEGAERLVLGLCGGRLPLGAVQREVRRAGFDPLGVEIVDLHRAWNEDRLDVMLAGARARAAAFRGSRPEQTKIVLARESSRRALLTFALPEYVAAPAVDASRCAADRGCTACVDICPQKALTIVDGRVLHDRAACEPCGRCVTTCPSSAIENPAATVPQIEAQVRALVDASVGAPGPRGIVYRCRRGERADDVDGWYPVTLPCSSMVPSSWLLAPLVLGASAVALEPCADSGCPLGGDDVARQGVDWARSVLGALGISPRRVTTSPGDSPLDQALPAASVADPFDRLGGAAVLLALAAASHPFRDTSPAPIAAPSGTFGVVRIDAGACTGCGACAAVCPTGALSASDATGQRRITFDAAACVACGACARRCPEQARGALDLRPTLDLERLAEGRVTLFHSELATCRSCGAPVAPSALLARLGELIGDELVLRSISGLCMDCRGVAASV